MQTLVSAAEGDAIPLWLVTDSGYATLSQSLPPMQAAWARAQGFGSERHRLQLLPDSTGAIAGAVLGLGSLRSVDDLSLWDAAPLPERLPAGTYRLATAVSPHAATQFALGWLLGSHRLTRYRSAPPKAPIANALVAPVGADQRYAHAAAQAMGWARDLISAPANQLGPEELAAAALELAAEHGGESVVHSGETLTRDYPLIAAVGAASARAPRLIDCRWRRAGAARVTLVGKGVCFDSGGLDLKPSAAMLLMKKDMGGAACALGLARLLLELDAPIELRLLIPAVDNSVGSRAYRPGDIWRSRRGLTVEIGNTDAEGRLVLADALHEADAERPELLIDLATLTGAARTALGPDLPAVFASNEALTAELAELGRTHADPVWPMPLWMGYDDELSSRVADLNNVSSSPFAGAIIAALFLKRFVTATSNWLHVDLYAWNPKDRPGRPLGAEAQCVRALYQLIRHRLG
ncbi:MAG TPA: leucyl aminopeptidase family protein [Steroidobacteraceae bacterium]|nr:leucyl aminopeptidase family protein [Steroidobacteraceae bacterium]